MKIAVPVSVNNQVDDHFGHCNFYDVFKISPNSEITELKRIPSLEGCGCKSNIAEILAAEGVTLMLAGGIGNGAINVLKNSGISVVRGCSGDAAEVVRLYLTGNVKDSGESCFHLDSHPDSDHKCSH